MFVIEILLQFLIVEPVPNYLCVFVLGLKDTIETLSLFFLGNPTAINGEDLFGACKEMTLITFRDLRPFSMASFILISSKNFFPIIGNFIS